MLLTEGPVLKAPKFDQAFQLQVDASNVGTGRAVSSQFDALGEIPIAPPPPLFIFLFFSDTSFLSH